MRLQILACLALLGAVPVPDAGAQTRLWIQQLGTVDVEIVYDTAPDGSGGLYVAGGTTGSFGGPNAGSGDAWLGSYDAMGNQNWIRQLGTSSDDTAQVVVSDGVDGLYVAGYTFGNLAAPHAGKPDAWIARYDGSGDQIWVQQLGSSEYDVVEDALPDGAGGVFVTGVTYGSLGGPHAGDADGWLAHYDGAGQQTWIEQWGTVRPNVPRSLASDGAGGLFVIGYGVRLASGAAGDLDAWVARYDPNGGRMWIQNFGGGADDFARSATPDGAGGVYITGHSGFMLFSDHDAWLARYDGAGNQNWLRYLGSADGDFSVFTVPDGAGGVVIGGVTYGSLAAAHSGGDDAWLASYDQAGNQVWIQQFGTTDDETFRTAASDGVGGMFVSGFASGNFAGPAQSGGDVWIARYNNVEESRYCNPATPNSTGQPSSLAVFGSSLIGANHLTLVARQLRPFSFGLFLTSPDQGLVMNPAGSQGNLCLGGAIGRFIGPGQVQNSGAAGTIELTIDLAAMPTPAGPVAVQPGDTWNFQAWYRDNNPSPTSNFTDANSVAFR